MSEVVKTYRCPICKKIAPAGKYKPFCSKRCADIDLGNWFNESYRIPVQEMDEEDYEELEKELEKRLDELYITVNKNTIPNEPLSPFITSGIRIGTAAVTTRGLGHDEMKQIAKFIALAVNDFENSKDFIKESVTEICKRYPIYN